MSTNPPVRTAAKGPKPFPWRATPPQSMPERLEIAASLARDLADPELLYESARRAFAASLLGLSGEELFYLGCLICQTLKTDPSAPAGRESGVPS